MPAYVVIPVPGSSFIRPVTSGYGLRLYGATSGSVGFVPPAIAGSVDYTLPSALPAATGVLTVSAGGTMSWVLASTYALAASLAAVATSGAYSDLTGKPSLATVATSGAYSDLTGRPSLATVATTGAYSDLSGKPTLGTAAAAILSSLLQVANNLSDLANAGTARTNLGLSTVAATGAYSDLSGKPDLTIYAQLAGAAFTGVVSGTQSIAGTSTDGFVHANNTAATVGVQQFSPRTRWTGQGWKTNATAGSQTVDFICENQPIQGSASPSGSLIFSSQVAGGGYAACLTISSSGSITAAGNAQVAASGAIICATRSKMTSPVDGIWLMQNNAGSGFSGLKFGGVTATDTFLKSTGSGVINLRTGDDSSDGTLILNVLRGGNLNTNNNSITVWQTANSTTATTFMVGATAPAIKFGVTTTAGPAIQRNGAGLDFMLADLSAYTNITYASAVVNGASAASAPGLHITGTPTTGGTGTTNYPHVYINSGTAPTSHSTSGTLLGFNGPSSYTGMIIDSHINGGASVFSVNYLGVVNLAGIKPTVTAVATATTWTPNSDASNNSSQTNTQTLGTLTVNAPTGSPVDGQLLSLRIKSTNVQTFSWNAIYRLSTDLALPTASSGSGKWDYVLFAYNSADTKWDILAKNFGH